MFRSTLARRSRGLLSGWLAGRARRRGIRIFRYHGVVERRTDPVLDRNQHTFASLREQAAYLSRFRVLGLDELLAELTAPAAAPRSTSPAAAITFDDGFANNLVAAEILERRELPWMLFVPSGEIGERRAMWLVTLSLWLMDGEAARVEALGAEWPLGTRDERERSFRRIRTALKALSAADRRREMDAIEAQLPAGETERLVDRHPELRILSAEELRGLSGAGVEIGSHGVHHEMHHAGQPAEVRERELSQSISDLERLLGRPCRAFAFPNGDILDESPEEAARAGYLAAFTTEEGSAEPGAPLHALPRLSAPGSLDRFVQVFSFEDAPPARESSALSLVPQPDAGRRKDA
ncbi:MAG TPA: polysaccharide deacetylase family protein [Thermoanaerobaculia bacterium]|nr:polysaccharide deacetylase family protein [Thermoanaerobaculia bacterium]